ncbi:Protein kinase domain-containing protein [Mycena indigotica]|uniref:Protein kinase domain-containing protein n=1 Tax=Mycena indigotica TaxID=2126181 RepID=A0A8H6T2V1_9AGAR|nr:Protein kinase domain-containing protein [Mycena indigotica]KAF7309352.1 Protein kinase domain-containing protein [Mycena indigotica]
MGNKLEDDPATTLRDDLEGVLNWNPPRFKPRKTGPPLPVHPLHWAYTRHLDSKLLLRSVAPIKSLVDDLSQLAQAHLDTFLDNNDPYPSQAFGFNMRQSARDLGPEQLADSYAESCGKVSCGIATKILIPKIRDWGGSVRWGRRIQLYGTPPGVDDNGRLLFLQDQTGKLHLFGDHSKLIDPNLHRDLERVLSYTPNIGTWVFLSFSRESKELLLGMDQLAARGSFNYQLCRTVGPGANVSSNPAPLDAESTPWTLPTSSNKPSPESVPRTLRATTVAVSKKLEERAAKRIIPSVRRRPETTAHVATPLTSESLVQLAWAKAVENNATMIVFNSGNHERLAVRHRGTQTLYISELYEIAKCKEPGYIKLHVGLYLAQVFDAIARSKAASEHTEPRRSNRKRPNTENTTTSSPPTKRFKQSAENISPELPMALASQRDMMLLHLQYDIYYSPAPASFFRTTQCLVHKSNRQPAYSTQIKRSYQPYETFDIVLTSRIGSGATGTVHGATARMTTKDGQRLTEENLIVKMAFKERPQRRMRHEYEVYKHLAEHGVTGVPRIYGLFEDLEGGAIALVMSNCGQDLWRLRPDKSKARTAVTPAQSNRFTEILENVHRAGVRHHDIRAENLMIDSAGEAFIVDFDRARLNPSEGKKKWEMDILQMLMEGIHHDFSIASPFMPGDEQEIWSQTPVSVRSRFWSEESGEDSEVDSQESEEDAGERRALHPRNPPHAIYNKHIDQKLLLQRVMPLGSLVNDISGFAQEQLDSLMAQLVSTEQDILPGDELAQFCNEYEELDTCWPQELAERYQETCSSICARIASKVLVPSMPGWKPSFYWGRWAEPDRYPTGLDDNSHLYFSKNDSGKIRFSEAISEAMEPSLREDLERAVASTPKIGTWILLSFTEGSETLLAKMEPTLLQETFRYGLCETVYPVFNWSSRVMPRDAPSRAWKLPPTGFVPAGMIARRNLRAKTLAASKQSRDAAGRVVPSARKRPETTAYVAAPLTPESLVQLAWAKAVETDSTMIVFNCGKYERLGIRHRATQTLYLSELYDITNCEPGYIKLHVGIYLAQVLDAIARAKATSNHTEPRRSSRKRPNADVVVPLPSNKRFKRDPKQGSSQPPMELASQRDLMLLHIQYGIYYSPAPASFIRATPCLVHKTKTKRKAGYSAPIKRSYEFYECLEVVLTNQIGKGATGTVHGATARLAAKDGQTLFEENLVVKLAFREQPQRRMRHEYDIYKHLAEHGVAGVPHVYGLFEDLEGGAIALVMSNCGQNLWDLREDKSH